MSRVLFLSRWYPYPPDNGSKLRIYNLLRGLAQEHRVSLVTFLEHEHHLSHDSCLASLCTDVFTVPYIRFVPGSLRSCLGFFGATPRSVQDTWSKEMAERIRELVLKRSYDLVIASQIDTAGYASCFRGLPALFEEVELGFMQEHFTRAATWTARTRYQLTWAKHRRYLASLLADFDACTVVSPQEAHLLSEAIPNAKNIEVIPNGVNVSDYAAVRKSPRANTLIFSGSLTFRPNYEGVLWFLEKVYPHIVAQIPGVSLTITGNHANLPLPQVYPVTLTGFVDDVYPLIAGSWISIAPIWRGGGTRLKILEAMALRAPVVATTKGAEGLAVQNGEHMLVADDPREFADAVIRLLAEPELRTRLTDNAYALVRERYDWRVILPGFLQLVDRVGGHLRSPTPPVTVQPPLL